MARRSPMTYKDAVRLLGKGDSGLVDALDQALGLGLLAVTAFSPASALPFFELKNEIISQLNKLVTELKDRVRKSRRIEYEQLLVAAHSVIVMAAHAEVLTEQMSDLDGGESLKRELHQWRPQAGSEQIPGKYDRRQFVEWADKSMIRPPGPARPLEDVTADLAKVYQRVSAQAIDYLKGLRCWDELRHSQQEKIEGTFLELWRQAISRYREHLFRLAAQIPEFMIWILLNESNATRALLRTMFASANVESHTVAVAFQDALERLEAITDAQGSALGDLSTVLGEMIDREGDGRRDVSRAIAECHKIHEMVLKKPLLEPRLTGELQMIRFPTSEVGYINPNFRTTETKESDEGRSLSRDDMWDSKEIRAGLGGFLAGYFRSVGATERPLLVLGDPGSGKSLLAKILAARLPPDEFAVARVELRHVRSSQEISDQIDLELQRQTHNRYHLQDLTDERGMITRVVIMDGLDELLQLSSNEGLGRYLELLAEFQECESELGHPVIAIATARTIVMDRIYVPSRTAVIKLEDFSDKQIHSWLETWNRENAEYFRSHQRDELDAETIMRQLHLARQPLLLSLLALYDAESDALRAAEKLSRAELYERIFYHYLERELEKSGLPVRKNERLPLVEQRFRELSTIAVGMINRGRRFLTRQEMVADFRDADVHRDPSLQAELTDTDDAVGQFFFLYRAQAQQDEIGIREGYEFIHATFGEFLAARIIAKQLARASDVIRDAPSWDRAQAERHAQSLLVPYLGRRPLVGEEQVLLYLEDIMGTLVKSRRQAATVIAEHIPPLLRSGIPEGSGQNTGLGQLDRLATLTVNLVVTALHTAKTALPLSVFCDEALNSLNEWRRLTTLWQTYLTIDDWDLVLSSFVVSDPPKFELSYQDARSRRRRDLAASSSDRHLWRQIQTGWLTGDGQLSGAASVWSWVCAALANDMRDTQPKVGRLIASAFFRLSPAHPGRATVTEALEELAAGKHEILKLIVGGPLRWPDAMLTEVADHLISANMAVDEVPILLQLIGELERRGSVTLASKMLRLMPTVIPQRISPADIAEIVSLSRRHEVPELISRNAAADWLAGPVSECLSVEDIVWIFQTSSIPSEDIERVRRQLQSNARLKRTAHWAGRILGEMLSIRLSAEEHRRPRGSFSEQLT